jgi:hypothetical protein
MWGRDKKLFYVAHKVEAASLLGICAPCLLVVRRDEKDEKAKREKEAQEPFVID